MSTKENKYVINSMKTLIDLNEDKKDFEITVDIKGDKPFLFSIVDQTMLDNTPRLNYEQGMNVTKSFRHINKPFQNYFLILKSPSEEEINIDIRINMTDLAGAQVTPVLDLDSKNHMSDDRKQLIERRIAMDEKDVENTLSESEDSGFAMYGLVITILILAIIFICKRK